MSEFYCENCGNVGELPTGERCDCRYGRGDAELGVVTCLTIPEQYRGLVFDESLIPSAGVSSYYPKYMRELYESIRLMKIVNKNIFLASPPKRGKSVLAHALTEHLFRRSIETFPLFDLGELHSIMKAVDSGKKPELLDGIDANALYVYTAPYLFVKIPQELTYSTFDTLATLIDRRSRRNKSTIILSDKPWNYLVEADKKGVLSGLVGDGSFGTIENKSFFSGGRE